MAENYSGTASPQYQAVLKLRSQLVKGMGSSKAVLVEIAQKLQERRLITLKEFIEIECSGTDISTKISELMDSVMAKIEKSAQFYSVLMDALRSSSLKDVGEKIEKTRDTLSKPKASPGVQVGGVMPENSPLLAGDPHSSAADTGKKLESRDAADSAFEEPLSTFTERNPPSQAIGGTVRQQATNLAAGKLSSPREVTNSAASSLTVSSGRAFQDTTHGECNKQLASMKKDKDIVQAEYAFLSTIREEELKVMNNLVIELSQCKDELASLKEEEKKRTEEMRELRLSSRSEQEKNTQLQKKIDDLKLKIASLEAEMKDEQLKQCQSTRQEDAVCEQLGATKLS